MNPDLKSRLASLPPDKIRALVAKMGGKKGATTPVAMALELGTPYPLSSAQKRVWFLCQLAPDSGVYNNPLSIRIQTSEPQDPARLEAALAELARRHPILRTTFENVDGAPVQIIHQASGIRVEFHDLRELPAGDREPEAQRIAVAIGRRRFDLVHGPLLFCAMVRLTEDEYLFLFTPHHLVSDGWSNMIFAEELVAIGAALSRGQRAALPEPGFQYVDFVRWETEWMQSQGYRQSLDYWKTQLRDVSEPLALPLDRPRPLVMSYAGAMEEMDLPAALQSELNRFCREQGATLYQVLLTAFKTLLFRYSGQTDLIVGMPVANRNKRDFQKVIGLFTNTLPLRTQLHGEMPFLEFLEQVKKVVQEALNHQQLPFERLIEELNPPRTLSIHPFYQVLLAQQTVPPAMKRFKVDYQSAKFDLNLWIEEGDDGVSFTLTYNADIFEQGTARRFLTHFKMLLEKAIAAPQTPLNRLDFISDSERAGLLARARTSAHPELEPERTFIECFEEQVRRNPKRAAVQHRDSVLTFAELNCQANQVAHALQARGVGLEARVGLLVERSPRSIVALLGILKAGAAYLPLDPTFPRERRQAMLSDAGATLVVADRLFEDEIAAMGIDALFLDDAEIAGASETNPTSALQPRHLAYLIYTSGTTGAPKGVCVEHRQLVNYCRGVWSVMKLPPAPRCATASSLAADLGNTMIFPALAFGGCVDVIPRELATDPVGLSRYFAAYPADCFKIVPSHLKSLLEVSEPRNLIPRNLLILGGESCPPDLLETIRSLRPESRILNHYGPTETTVGVLTYEVGPAYSANGGRNVLPIGAPLPGTEVYLLDPAGQLVPDGLMGEIYVGGANVTRGYWQKDQLTADRFVPNPFSENGGRLYRTGDKGKRLPDGNLVFLGRTDRQFKIRGFRVELGEIEAALLRQPGIDQAVVRPPSPDEPRQSIVAYLKSKTGRKPDLDRIKTELARWLPGHAIPSTYVVLDEIPRSPHGKINYQALPAPDSFREIRPAEAPRDALEIQLIQMWEELLGTTGIGIHDNFFELGGHSLLAVQLMSKMDKTFQVRLPLASLFEFGTIHQISAFLRSEMPVSFASPVVSIQRHGEGAPLFFVHPAGGHVLCYYEFARSLGREHPFYGLQAIPGGTRNSEELEGPSIREMAQTYLEAVLETKPAGVPIFGGWSMGALVAFEMARLDHEKRGLLPPVFVLDQLAPRESMTAAVDEPAEVSRLISFGAKVSQLIGQDLGLDGPLLENKTPSERALEFLIRFKNHKLTPEDTSLPEFEGYLGLMLHHNRITSDYAPEPYEGQIIVIRAEAPLPVDPRLAAAMGAPLERTPDLGWQRLSRRPVEVIHVPGNHVTMMTEPHVAIMASRILKFLETHLPGGQHLTAANL